MSAYESPKRMACVACTRAKRKCSKEVPVCARCVERNEDCVYPVRGLMLPPSLVPGDEERILAAPVASRMSSSPLVPPIPAQLPTSLTLNLASPWFLSPSSWTKRPIDMTGVTSFRREDLFYFTEVIQKWTRQWTSQASCPFIHCQLYGPDLPECLQNAYTAVAAYEGATPATKTTVLHILEDRANDLVGEQGLFPDEPPDTATSLARTQALLVYEIIRLFDGDIASRHDAERHLQTLVLWAESVRESAELDIGSGQMDVEPAFHPPDFGLGGDRWARAHLRTDGRLSSTWRAWVFSESIRRTWYAVMLTETVYAMLKQGCPRCHGSLPFMGGKSLWDAPTPYDWLDALRRDNVSVVRSLTDPRLFAEVPSSDADELTHAVLISVYGLERVEQWIREGPRGRVG